MKEPFIFLCREITREHAQALIRWMRDDEVRKYLSDSDDVSFEIEQVLERVRLPVLTHLFSQNGRFYIAYDNKHRAVGFVRLVVNNKDAEMVVVIGDRADWGKGLGTSTIRECMKIAFQEMRTEKLTANVHKQNMRSIRAFRRAGFRVAHEHASMVCFMITREEYFKPQPPLAVLPQEIYITETDLGRLQKLINEEWSRSSRPAKHFADLEQEIKRAIIVGATQIPADVITMNSQACLRLNGEQLAVSLVYPREADFTANRLSVLSPIGTAILGCREGHSFNWVVPSGTAEIEVRKILYQPEAAGDYHL